MCGENCHVILIPGLKERLFVKHGPHAMLSAKQNIDPQLERCSSPSFVVYRHLIRLPERVGIRNLSQRGKSRSRDTICEMCPKCMRNYFHACQFCSLESFAILSTFLTLPKIA